MRSARINPIGTKFDWEIICEVATAMGYIMHYKNSAVIMDEIASLTPSCGEIHYYKLEKQGLQLAMLQRYAFPVQRFCTGMDILSAQTAKTFFHRQSLKNQKFTFTIRATKRVG